MRVLVTGHLGYIGTLLVPLLLRNGHEVVGLDTDFYGSSTFCGAIAPVAHVSGDIRDARAADVRGFDAVLHLAALSSDPLGNLNASVTHDINCRGTMQLAEAAKAAGVRRFVFSSSCSNYGAAGDELLTEEAPLNPVTPYGRSKVEAEDGLRGLADDRFHPVFLRNATAYGVSPRLRCDLVLNNLTACAAISGRIHMTSDGSPWRPVVHAEDIGRAFVAALESPESLVRNQAFNVGRTAENYRVRELARIVCDTVPGSTLEHATGAGPDARNYRVDCDKIARVLPAFQPRWTAASGARQLYDAFARHGFTIEEFEGADYRRADRITTLLAEGRLDRDLRWVEGAHHAIA